MIGWLLIGIMAWIVSAVAGGLLLARVIDHAENAARSGQDPSTTSTARGLVLVRNDLGE